MESEGDELTAGDPTNGNHVQQTPDPLSSREVSTMELYRDHESGENPFDVAAEEPEEDPDAVNIHQFYPVLEHSFTKSSITFSKEQDKRVEEAMKELVDSTRTMSLLSEGSEGKGLTTFSTDDTESRVTTDMSREVTTLSDVKEHEEVLNGEVTGDHTNMKVVKFVTGDEEASTCESQKIPVVAQGEIPAGAQGDVSENDTCNSADAKPTGVFSTAVNEETIVKAQARARQHAVKDDWVQQSGSSTSMQEIVDRRAEEHFLKAMERKEQHDYQGTISCINKALSLHPDNPLYFKERAEMYVQLCDFQSAILNYKKACLLETNNRAYYYRLAFLYFFQGQLLFDQQLFAEALESFSRAAEMNSDNIGYHIRSIACLAALHRHGECLALVNQRLDVESDNPDLFIMRARLHEMFRNTTLSYYDIKDALALDPDHAEAQNMMQNLEKRAEENKRHALQLTLVGKHREGLQKVSIAIETNPAVDDFHVIRGTIHRKLSDFNAAIDDFLLALDKCEHNEESAVYMDAQRQLLLTYNDFAVECFTKGFYDEAVILLNKAIKGEKDEKGLYVNRGDCFFRQEELNFALQDYIQALELDPDDQAIHSRISVIYNDFAVSAYQEKEYSEAEAKFSLALEYSPRMGQYYISRARARYMMENMVEARQDLLIGLILDPMNEDVISILSRLFPGKSMSDVINSKAGDTAKLAIKSIIMSASSSQGESVSSISSQDGDTTTEKADSEAAEVLTMSSRKKKPTSQLPQLKTCMAEQEFNIRLAVGKKIVNDKVKGALNERKTLKYTGPRVKPLPPPSKTRLYGGRGIVREKVVEPQPNRKRGYNWRRFNMGVGVTDVAN